MIRNARSIIKSKFDDIFSRMPSFIGVLALKWFRFTSFVFCVKQKEGEQ